MFCENAKFNKLLIFVILIVFFLSINFAFAIDENQTNEISDTIEDSPVSIDETSNDNLEVSEKNTIDAEDNSKTDPSKLQTIKMDKVTKRYNGIIQYQATFYDDSGSPLANTEVLFEVDDDKDYKVQTDSKGIALLTIKISNGNHKIAAFNPSTLNISYDNFKVYNVLSANKNIKMYYDGADKYKVRVYGEDGKPLKAGKTVTFKINGKKYYKKTDKNGYAKLKITNKPGYYYIYATYKDYTVYNTVYVKPVLKQLSSFRGRFLISSFKYKIKFLGKNKKNKKIKVKFNKKTYKAKTNKKGIATFNLKVPKKAGSYKVVASYKKTKVSSLFSKG